MPATLTRTRVEPKDFFGPNGVYAKARKGFVARPGQEAACALVLKQLAQSEHTLLEGPTGFGKSLTLLAAAFCAIINREVSRVVISTETLALAAQYLHQDLPFVQKAVHDALGVYVEFAEAKGRGNTICRNKLPYDEEGDGRFLREGMTPLQLWAADQEPGRDRGDIGSIPGTVEHTGKEWSELCGDDDCERRGCPFYGNGAKADGHTDCFVFQARKDFLQAQIVVTNHSMLCLDRANVTKGDPCGPILSDGQDPDNLINGGFGLLIVDEAHTLPQKAQDAWGYELSPRSISVTVRGVSRMFKRAHLDVFEDDYMDVWQEMEAAIFAPFQTHVGKAMPFDKLPTEVVEGATAAKELALARLKALRKDLKNALRDSDLPEQKKDDLLDSSTKKLGRLFKALQAIFDENGSENDEMEETPEMADNWLSFMETSRNNKGVEQIKLKVKPIEVGPLMSVKLFGTIRSVVLASATLQVDGSFGFPRRRMGIPRSAAEFVGDTPFDLARQVRAYFPVNLPFPTNRGDFYGTGRFDANAYNEALREYNIATAARTADLIEMTGGGGLILFTSNQGMQDAFWDVREELKRRKLRIACFMQGDRPKHTLVQMKKDDPNSVLFATKSFFTGVDIPGEALRLLVMLRAPFAVPTDPMYVAMCDKIKAKGGDPFRELSMPLMLMEAAQGFGRLIRSESDSGVVALLDSRANTKPYGQKLRKLVAGAKTFKLPADAVVVEEEEDEE